MGLRQDVRCLPESDSHYTIRWSIYWTREALDDAVIGSSCIEVFIVLPQWRIAFILAACTGCEMGASPEQVRKNVADMTDEK